MAASSLTKCGRLPVFSNCSITPTTMSSLIPSVSILGATRSAGDGGGVCSMVARRPEGRTDCRFTWVEEVEEAEGSGDSEPAWCDLLTFLGGGNWSSVACDDLEVDGERREELGK